MNRLRIGLVMSMIIGLLYASFGIFESLTKFGVGVAVAAAAVVGLGLLDFLKARN
jgi:L-lactate permease